MYFCQWNFCWVASASRAVDRLVSERDSMVVSGGCLLVKIKKLARWARLGILCVIKSNFVVALCMCGRGGGCCERGRKSRLRAGHVKLALDQREAVGACWSSGVRSFIIATDARRAFTSTFAIAPDAPLKPRMHRDPCPRSPQ